MRRTVALRIELARLGLAREHVVGGDDPRVAVSPRQVLVERLHRKPLEVHDVGRGAKSAACRGCAWPGAPSAARARGGSGKSSRTV
jgi:hypothetical protein